MRTVAIAACLTGLAISGIALALLSFAPRLVEDHVRDAVVSLLRSEVAESVGPKVDVEAVAELAKRAVERKMAGLSERMESQLPEAVALIFTHLCHYECSSRNEVAASLRAKLAEKVIGLERGLARVSVWAESRYARLVTEFVHELTIFFGANAGLFALALLGLLRAPRNSVIEKTSLLLLVSTLTVAATYFASQNWLLTFVTADYLGWSYLACVAAAFVLLVDNAFLKATITSALLNAIGALVPGGAT
ncbi:MAG: hypothetical protein QM778_28785 [Myxococcales bacterium]